MEESCQIDGASIGKMTISYQGVFLPREKEFLSDCASAYRAVNAPDDVRVVVVDIVLWFVPGTAW